MRHCLQQTVLGALLWGIFLIKDSCRRAQITMADAGPGHMALSHIRKKTEQVVGRKVVNRIPPWPLLQFLPPIPALAALGDV